jgi:hypothetical protein
LRRFDDTLMGRFSGSGLSTMRKAARMGTKAQKPRCTVCRHAERARIELLRLAGVSLDNLASQFGVKRDAVHRHMAKHVSDADKAAYLADIPLDQLKARAADEGVSLLDFLRIVRATLIRRFQIAAEAGDNHATASLAGRLNETLALIGKLTGEIARLVPGMTVNNNTMVLIESPAFAELQGRLLKALAPFPDARAAVVAALASFDAEEASTRALGRPSEQARVIEHA